MHDHDTNGAQARPVWAFMAATAMATTISTLAATAMVKGESTEPVAVTCSCEAPAAPLVQTEAPVRPEAPEQAQAPAPPEAPAPAQAEDAPIAPPKVEGSPAPKAEVHGALDRDVIRRIVRAHIGEVRYCYNEGLEHDPELRGRVVVDFVIGAEGKVTRSSAEADFEGDVPDCIAKAVARWLFPRPADGGDVAVKYPFVLEPG